MKKHWVKKIPLIIGAVVLGAAAFSGLVMLLWNATVSPIFHISSISLLQAAGLLLLAKILFGGFKGRNGMGRHRMMHKHWATLTDEQKQEFKQRMHGCSGRHTMC